MHVEDIVTIEECEDGATVREYVLDQPMTRELVMRLAELGGQLKLFDTLPKPFFKIEFPDRYELQGVLGNCTVRARLAGNGRLAVQETLIACIEGNSGQAD